MQKLLRVIKEPDMTVIRRGYEVPIIPVRQELGE